MRNKKGVIGVYWVVTAAIALVILILMVSMIKGGVGSGVTEMFKIKESVSNPLEQERMTCQNLCNQAKVRNYEQVEQWKASSYCRRSMSIDLNGDGNISDGETGLHCWDPNGAYVFCKVTLADGTTYTQDDC